MRLTIKLISTLVCFFIMLNISCASQQVEKKPEPKPSEQIQPDAKEIFIQVCKKPDETKGFHFKMSIEQIVESTEQTDPPKPPLKQSIETQGKQQNPDMLYLESSFEEGKIEIVAKGNKLALRTSIKDEWQLQPDPTRNGTQEMTPLKQLLRASKYIKSAKFIEESEINGITCRGIEVALTDKGFTELAGDKIHLFYNVKYSDASYNIWFDSKNLLPYRIVSYVNMVVNNLSDDKDKPTDKSSTKVVIDLSDYDKDIEIILPDEVKKLFEKVKTVNETPEGNRENPKEIQIPESNPSEPKKGN